MIYFAPNKRWNTQISISFLSLFPFMFPFPRSLFLVQQQPKLGISIHRFLVHHTFINFRVIFFLSYRVDSCQWVSMAVLREASIVAYCSVYDIIPIKILKMIIIFMRKIMIASEKGERGTGRERSRFETPAENHQIIMYDKSCFDHKFWVPFLRSLHSQFFSSDYLALSLPPAVTRCFGPLLFGAFPLIRFHFDWDAACALLSNITIRVYLFDVESIDK